MIAVTILGNNSAVPAHGRHPTSQVVQTQDQFFLVDCGEGTQMQMNLYKVRKSRINHIFISHLHGDHYFGLIGLINTYGLNKRTHELHVYAPPGLKEIIELQLNTVNAHMPFPLHFHEISEEGILLDDPKMEVSCFKVNHRITCYGFIFRERKNKRKIDLEKTEKNHIPKTFFENLQNGEDYIKKDGTVISNDQLTSPAPPGKSYAFCADTTYFEEICEKVKNVDMVYHETTYLHDLAEKARDRFHATSVQAAMIAKKANAKKLLMGHFSSMYESLDGFLKEASGVFPNCEIAQEGACYVVE